MTEADWVIVWDVYETNHDLWSTPLAALAVSIIGFFAYLVLPRINSGARRSGIGWYPDFLEPMNSAGEKLFVGLGATAGIGGAVFAAVFLVINVSTYADARMKYDQQRYEVVIGEVGKFEPATIRSHSSRDESFEVANQIFTYFPGSPSCVCYVGNTLSNPDLRNGDLVEIWHVDGEILRLLVMQRADGTVTPH